MIVEDFEHYNLNNGFLKQMNLGCLDFSIDI